MDVICRAPKQTFAKLCYKSAEKQEIILADATAKTYFTTEDDCTMMANPSTDPAVVKADPLVKKTSDGKAYDDTCNRDAVDNKCNKYLNYVWDCPVNPDTDYPFRSADENSCMKAGPGYGLGQWLITHYNNTGSKEQTPEEVSASIHSGTGGPSNPGYCSDSVTVTKSVYGVKTNDLYAWLNGAGKTAAGWFADFEKTKTVILVSGIVLSMIMAFSWIILMKNFAKCICWLTLIFSMMTLIALNLCLYVKAGVIGPNILGGMQALVAKQNPELADQIPNSFPDYLAPSETRKNLYKWTAMFMTVFILIVLVAMFKFRQKINVAIQMCKEAAKAIVSMPLIVFWPFLNVILLVCMMCYFIFIAMYIASAANLQTLNVKVNEKYQASMVKMKDASNYAIDKGNAAGSSATDAYNKQVEKWDKDGFSKDDWNAVQHMQWNTTSVQPLNFEANTLIRYGLIVHTAGMWWISLVIVIVGYYTISSAVAQWYFNDGKYLDQSRAKQNKEYEEKCQCGPCAFSVKEQLNTPVVDACKKGCRFHVGSFALSAFLSMLVAFLKFCFLWINKIVSFIPGNNVCSRKLKACMFMGMGFFDKFVRIISRNGIIMMAIRGQDYCTSAGWASWLIFAAQDNPKNLEEGAKSMEKTDKARKAYNTKQAKLIKELEALEPKAGATYESFSFVSGGEVSKTVQIETEKCKERQLDQERGKLTSYEGPYKTQSYNAAQYAVLSLITDILLFLGKLVVVVSCGILAYAWVTSSYKDGELTSSAAPIAVAMLFSYFIVSAFMSVYDLSIDTILLCFFYDKLQNKGGPYAMSPQLKKLVLNNLPPGTDKTNMKKGDSFFFSNAVTRRGTIAIGAGWDQEQSRPTGAAGQKSAAQMGTAQTSVFVTNPDLDIDLAMAIYDRDAKLLDYIGYMEAVKPNGQTGMALKKTAGGDLFVDSPGKTLSNINPEAVAWSGDDKSGNSSKLNVAGLNEDITVRLHEMPINVDTLAFVLFSFKGPCFNQISDLRLYATECTTSDNRRPEVVAKFNCDFSLDTLEGAQQALLCVTLRRNPGPTFPKGDCKWAPDQITFARDFCSKKIVGDKYKDYLEKEIKSKNLISDVDYLEIVTLVNAAHENEYDQILNDQKKAHKSGAGGNRSLQQRLDVHAEICASDIIFNVLSEATKSKCAKQLSAQQLMIWNRTFSKFNTQGGSEPHGDMIGEDEDYFDCAWEIQAQRELMGNRKFTASIVNAVARKCFFFRTPGDKFDAANGSYCGRAVAVAGAFMATA
jgi:stress response protein SCP2